MTMQPLDQTLAERGTRYGDFSSRARIAQDLQDIMRNADGWHRMRAMHRQALTTIADKIARILNGDPDYADNWRDIQGYARLVEQRLSNPVHSSSAKGDYVPHEAAADKQTVENQWTEEELRLLRSGERSGKIADAPHNRLRGSLGDCYPCV